MDVKCSAKCLEQGHGCSVVAAGGGVCIQLSRRSSYRGHAHFRDGTKENPNAGASPQDDAGDTHRSGMFTLKV